MAVSMRFLAKASQSFENLVAHAPSPKTLRTPKTPKTPASFGISPKPVSPTLSPALNFFPEERAEKRVPKFPARSVHFADASGPTWVGNATRLLGGRLQARTETTPITDVNDAASATRDAVLARLARKEDRSSPLLPRGARNPEVPVLLGRHAITDTTLESVSEVNEASCASAARTAFLAMQERRASRAMVDFMI